MTLWKTHSMGQGKGPNGKGDDNSVAKGRHSCEDERKCIPANSQISGLISNDELLGEMFPRFGRVCPQSC